MRSVLFALSGADAVEGAMHLAMRANGGSEFVSLYSAFHGATFATLAYLSAHAGRREGRPRPLHDAADPRSELQLLSLPAADDAEQLRPGLRQDDGSRDHASA
ncbi:hypothetical protein [Mesorhizobium sp. A623]